MRFNKNTPDVPAASDAAFLGRIFDDADENGQIRNFPLVEPPVSLIRHLYDIAQQSPGYGSLRRYRPIAIAASLTLVLLPGIDYYSGYQEQQVAQQVHQDLVTAFLYLQRANQKASAKLSDTLTDNIGEATLKPLRKSTERDSYEKI